MNLHTHAHAAATRRRPAQSTARQSAELVGAAGRICSRRPSPWCLGPGPRIDTHAEIMHVTATAPACAPALPAPKLSIVSTNSEQAIQQQVPSTLDGVRKRDGIRTCDMIWTFAAERGSCCHQEPDGSWICRFRPLSFYGPRPAQFNGLLAGRFGLDFSTHRGFGRIALSNAVSLASVSESYSGRAFLARGLVHYVSRRGRCNNQAHRASTPHHSVRTKNARDLQARSDIHWQSGEGNPEGPDRAGADLDRRPRQRDPQRRIAPGPSP